MAKMPWVVDERVQFEGELRFEEGLAFGSRRLGLENLIRKRSKAPAERSRKLHAS